MALILVSCTQALPVFLCGLEVGSQQELLHSGVRQYLHRMIICMGDELLTFIPMAVSLLLKDCKVGSTRPVNYTIFAWGKCEFLPTMAILDPQTSFLDEV